MSVPMTQEQAYAECCRIAREHALIFQAAGGFVTIVHPDTQKAENIFERIQYVHGLGDHPDEIARRAAAIEAAA